MSTETTTGEPVTSSAHSAVDPNLLELGQTCVSMFKFAVKSGKNLKGAQVEKLHNLEARIRDPKEDVSYEEVLNLYNYLVGVVKPARPRTILLMDKEKAKGRGRLGALPIVSQLLVLGIISLSSMILLSLFKDLNNVTIQKSLLEGYGPSQILRLLFLMSAAGVGASFYSLFEINKYVSNSTYDPIYKSIYWTRFILGIISGLLLAEFFADSVGGAEELKGYGHMIKPMLAILGGYSANLVYQILNRLVQAVEGLFSGDPKAKTGQKISDVKKEAEMNSEKMKAEVTQKLLELKGNLMNSPEAASAIEQIDKSIQDVKNAEL